MNSFPELAILCQVVLIDLSLAADNAIVIGMVAGGLDLPQRHRAVWVGLGFAVTIRIALALLATQLLAIPGLAALGGLVLLWITWRMAVSLGIGGKLPTKKLAAKLGLPDPPPPREAPPKTFRGAIGQIIAADIGMSMDNILAVAGAAGTHTYALIVGLVLSIALIGIAASASARMLHRWPWLNWCGIVVILFVGLRMIVEGGTEIWKLIH